MGLALFSTRFWIQWWCAEQEKKSYLSGSFWWISLIGESLCLIYFLKIHDPVNSIGPAFGLIPYIRNLMLIYKKQPIEFLTKNSPQAEL
jgi:lipid-A-disaccharide synthase